MAQIQAALEFVIHVDALVMGLEVNMNKLNLDESNDGNLLDLDAKLRDLVVAKKKQLVQKAKPYSQASWAMEFKPDGTFPGVKAKYRSGAPKFLTLAEAEELNRISKRAIALEEKEQPSAVIGSQGSAFRTAHWQQPEADFSSERYRDPTSDFDDDDPDESEQEQEDADEEENEGDPPQTFMHLRRRPIEEMLV
jgi:hypothetical protein